MKKIRENYKDSINALLVKTKNSEYTIVKAADDKFGTGFSAIAIKDSQNEVTVACRGTEGFSILSSDASRRDAEADLELAFMLSTSQQEQMAKFMNDLDNENYDGYYFTGHSLGGNLANFGAITFRPLAKVKGVVTFNAPGYNESFINLHAAEIAEIYKKLKNYQNEYDYVSSTMIVPGDQIIVDSSKNGGFLGLGHLNFDDHSLNTMSISGAGFSRKKPQIKAVQTIFFHYIIEFIRNMPIVKKAALIVHIFEITICFGRFAADKLKDVIAWASETDFSSQGAGWSPIIEINTATMRSYAERLTTVNKRIVDLDRRLNALYKKVGLRDLWSLLQADLMTGYNWKIKNCAQYLNETANDFDNTEREVINQF